jgi:RNA polymerase sigma factor (sigma-70 family)
LGYQKTKSVLMSNNPSQEMNDELLISSLAIGESKAINYIYKTFYPTIEKMVFKMNGSTDDAYDIFQDSVTILYEKAKKNELVLTCQLSTYITSVARNLWLSKLYQRKQQSFSVVYENMGENISVEDDIEKFHIFEKNANKLQIGLKKLGEPCKSLIEAFYIHNKSMNDIVDQFHYTNTDNAKTQKYKCLNRLRKLFFSDKDQKIEHERI